MNSLFLPAVFSTALFVSAALLFLVEAMIAKMILPLLGGTPAVWNTCMMFFQAMLLAGYAYAHIVSRKIVFRKQVIVHCAILVIACVMLPLAVSRKWIFMDISPIWTVLALLTFSVSLPFFVLSSSAPLLQKWFANTGHPGAKDPFFLYSASNLGSMLALLSYPTLIEPRFTLAQQSFLWATGYGVFAVLTGVCAFLARRYLSSCFADVGSQGETPPESTVDAQCGPAPEGPTVAQRLRWIALSFIPSSLMLGVTTFFTTDIAAIPLFWVVPLALYLLSFIIVFAKMPPVIHRLMIRLLPVAVITLLFFSYSYIKTPLGVTFFLHLSAFFVVAMVCHGELAMGRPHPKYLTEFYLLMSTGGVLGGIFNALVAPVTFKSVVEYPLVLVLACLFLPVAGKKEGTAPKRYLSLTLDFGMPLLIGIITSMLIIYWPVATWDLSSLSNLLKMEENTLQKTIIYGIPAILCFTFVFMQRPVRFGLAVGAFVIASAVSIEWDSDILYRDRSFFGVLTVVNDYDGQYRSLVHGTTLHGKQHLHPDWKLEPFTYFHREGPIGQFFEAFGKDKTKKNIAVLGLGIGTLAAYAHEGQDFTFYEIDPAVKDVATNPAYFTFLQNCRATSKIIIGDGRLKIEESPDRHYDIIVFDAFSSDAIPVHLLTREALKMYLSKLNEGGILALQITNKYVSLEPVLERLAKDAGLVGLFQHADYDLDIGKYASKWVLLARTPAHLGNLWHDERWQKLDGWNPGKVWTDDFSNVLSVFYW